MSKERCPKNAPGPFYVASDCCIFCGVPAATAPALFDEDDDSCFVRRQPATPGEVDRMVLAMVTADLGCIRYAGNDGAILHRLAERGEGALADSPAPRIPRVDRDHAALRAVKIAGDAQTLMEAFMAYQLRRPLADRHKFVLGEVGPDRCDLRLSWYEENFHSVSFQRSTVPEFDWLVVGLPLMVVDWLADNPIAEAVFFDRADWLGDRAAGTNLPW